MAITLKYNGQNVAAKADANGFLLVAEGYARAQENVTVVSATGSTLAYGDDCRLWGLWVSSASNATLAFYNESVSGKKVIPTFAASAGYQALIPGARFTGGVHIEMEAGGTIDYAVGVEPIA